MMQCSDMLDILSEHEIGDWIITPELPENERQQELRAMHDTVAALAWAMPAVTPPPGLRERLMARVAQEQSARREEEKPFVAANFLTVRAAEGKWNEVAPGIKFKKLFVDKAKGTVTSLYRLAPGSVIKRHRHKGHEQTFILEGDCRVGDEMFYSGDYQCAPAGTVHDTVSTVNGTLLLVVAPLEYELLG